MFSDDWLNALIDILRNFVNRVQLEIKKHATLFFKNNNWIE